MTSSLDLPALAADNPLGYLAALGALEVAHRHDPGVRLHWKGRLVPRAVLSGVVWEQLVDWVLADARQMLGSAVLAWPPHAPLTDLKMGAGRLSAWGQVMVGQEPWVVDQWSGLVAENAFDNSGTSKPTHLHFTAGRQQFLDMVRQLGSAMTPDLLSEALLGPWTYTSTLPSLSWDSRGERIYALRGKNPATDKRTGVPAADWLAFRGLCFYPTSAAKGRLRTTACDDRWKVSALRWPVWTSPLTRDVVRSLTGRADLVAEKQDTTAPGTAQALARQGVLRVHQARINRTDQGGYGSFSPPTVLHESGSEG